MNVWSENFKKIAINYTFKAISEYSKGHQIMILMYQLNFSIMIVEYGEGKERKRTKRTIGRFLKKRVRDVKHSEATNAVRERREKKS